MFDQYNWPSGFCLNPDFRYQGPEAQPGNMQFLADVIDDIRNKIIELQDKVIELDVRLADAQTQDN